MISTNDATGVRRRRRLLGILSIAVLLIGAATCFMWTRPLLEHPAWSKRVKKDIYALAARRPPDVQPGQWEFVVGWTLNLHANCASDFTQVDSRAADEFVEELERRMGDTINLATIDWIWNEYSKFTKHGKEYSDKYRPTDPDRLAGAQPGCFGIQVN